MGVTIQRVDTPQGLPAANVIVRAGSRSLKLDSAQWRELITHTKDIEFLVAFILGQISLDPI